MKSIILILTCITSLCFADDATPPCMQMKKACEAAGFQKGKAKDGKGLVKDCMSKLSRGESVSGVTLSADVISGCKEKHEQ